MASLSKGLSGAATGAAIGSAVPVIGTGIGAIAGGLIGLFSGDDDNEAAAKLEAAAEAIKAIDIPEIDKAIALQQFQQTGTFSPELMEKIQLEADKKTALVENPENRARQEMALNALKELSQTGMSATDRAQIAETRSQIAQDLQAKNAQITQEAQMRGQPSSGQEIAQKLLSVQGGAQQASKDAMQQAAAAEQARRDALNQFLSGSERLRAADLGASQFNFTNELERKRFLDQNSLSRLQANTDIVNRANLLNLQRQQQVSDMNIQSANQELARQKQAQYQKFQAELAKRSAIANVYGSQAGLAQRQSEADAAGTMDLLSGLGKFATAGKDAGWWGTPKTVKNMTFSEAEDAYDKQRKQRAQGIGLAYGGRIPGEASVDGDSHKNDIVPAMLSPDEIVVPRSKAKDPKKAKSFIDEVFEQEKLDKKQKKGYDRNESILDLIAKLHSEKSK